MTAEPVLVTLHLWGVANGGIPRSLARLATQRHAVRSFPGVTFAKLLGTGSGTTFDLRDADLGHWALLTCWDSSQCAGAFEHSRTVKTWDSHCTERLRIELIPVRSSGRWSGREPFGDPRITIDNLPAVALTRARLRITRARSFWRAVPAVSTAVNRATGLAMALAVGEAPVGFQGTFSVWDDTDSLRQFAYSNDEHKAVVSRTPDEGWYAEELFARFAMLGDEGTYCGRSLWNQ